MVRLWLSITAPVTNQVSSWAARAEAGWYLANISKKGRFLSGIGDSFLKRAVRGRWYYVPFR